jgi:hypothetical protein
MRHFRIKKSDRQRKPLIHETRFPLPKPKFPRSVFWKPHELGKPSREIF